MTLRLSLAAATLAALCIAPAGAQTATPAANATYAPAPAATPLLTPTNNPEPTAKPEATTVPAKKLQVKHLKTATLPTRQIAYALTHQLSEAKQLAHMKTIDFDHLRVVRLNGATKGGLLRLFHLRVDSGERTELLAAAPFALADATIAQATPAPSITNGDNSPLQFLHNVLANINVSNALNNLLNNSTVSANVSLQNVLNNNKIAIGQVVGIYIGGGGFINTIIK